MGMSVTKIVLDSIKAGGYAKQDFHDEFPRIAKEAGNCSTLLDWRKSFLADAAAYLQQTLSDWISEAEESVGDCSAALGILKACESDCDWEEVAKELLENRYWGDDAIEQLIQLASNLDAWVTERLCFEEYQEACEDYARHSGTCSCYCYGFRTWLDHGKRMIPFVIENGSARMLEWGVKS
jgi:hypothetical protein